VSRSYTSEVKVQSTLKLGASFTLPTNEDAKTAMLDAIKLAVKKTIEATLSGNQAAGEVTIITVNGQAISQRRLLERLLEGEGDVEWESSVTETTTVVTKTNPDGKIVEAIVNGEEQPVDDNTDGATVLSIASNTESIGSGIVSQVATALETATSTDGGGTSTPAFLTTLEESVEEVVTASSVPIERSALDSVTAAIEVAPAVTDVNQAVEVTQNATEPVSTTETVDVVLTASPTTPSPTNKPTGTPTKTPTNRPTSITEGIIGAAPTPPADDPSPTSFEVKAPGTFVIQGVTCTPGTTVSTSLATSVENALKSSGCPAGTNCAADVTKIECQSSRRALRALSISSLVVEFEAILNVYCQQFDCSDVTDISNAVYAQLTSAFAGAIADGTFVTALQSNSGFGSSLVDVNSLEFDAVVVPLLSMLTSWYPGWHNGEATCRNDGNAPTYMTIMGTYIKSSLEECCTSYYSWDFTLCLILAGASSSAYATNEFYVDHETETCKQSCNEGTEGLNCAGIAGPWEDMFSTAVACCTEKLWWVDQNSCVAKSTLTPSTTPLGSSQWYRKGNKCVKDCEVSSSDAQCGGLAERWDDTFASAGTCCNTKVWWVDLNQCT